MMWRAVLVRGGLLALLWWMLTEGSMVAWGVGLVSVLLATLASLWLLPPAGGRFSVLGGLLFLVWFMRESVKGGVQVAQLAFQRRPDLVPDMVELDLTLPDGMPRVVLANTLSLLPGTLSAQLDGARLCLHVLDVRVAVLDDVRGAEARIARMLRVPLEAPP